MASRMLVDKGVRDLVAAARELAQRGVRARFILAGTPDPGNPASIPEEDLRSWSQDGSVEWLGQVDDVAGLYARSHIVVLPSYGEGLPRSLIEAAAAGRPIVATDVPGCREVVRDDYNGILVPPRDPARLADAIAELTGDRHKRMEMGRRGRELAVAEFSTRRVIADTFQLYREMLGDGDGRWGQADDRGAL
jgi:glycosyltransferase involved in cell wall biosynthesis